MNKSDLIKAVATETGITQSITEGIINTAIDAITKALRAGNEVAIHGLGKFTVKDKPARTGRNPRTGEAVQIAASKSVKFKATKGLV